MRAKCWLGAWGSLHKSCFLDLHHDPVFPGWGARGYEKTGGLAKAGQCVGSADGVHIRPGRPRPPALFRKPETLGRE